MPDGDGLWTTEQIAADPASRGEGRDRDDFELDEYVARAIRAGASGFLVKDTEPVDLIRAVRVVAAGDALLSPGVTRRLLERAAIGHEGCRRPATLAALTEREREVLRLVAQGLTNDEIAARLFLSPLTAKTHVSRIMQKLHARDRVQLVVLAYESGLVAPGWQLAPPRRSTPPGAHRVRPAGRFADAAAALTRGIRSATRRRRPRRRTIHVCAALATAAVATHFAGPWAWLGPGSC